MYVDEKPVYTTEGDYFNHVNGTYTTKDAFYTINNLDLSVPHTFRVEAADAWWRAEDGSGPFHWTNRGPEIMWSILEPEPEPTPNPTSNPARSDRDSDSDRDYGIRKPSGSGEVTGDWKQDEKGWRLKKKDGSYPKEEWAKVNGVWYYFGQTGYMTTGWKQVEGKWYYLATDGGMQTNWVWTGENWYFMNADGSMATGWVMVNDSWYYLNQSGECLFNTVTPDGYRVNEKGEWMKS